MVPGNIRLWKKPFWTGKKQQNTLSMPQSPIKVVHLITLLEFGGAQGNTLHTVQTLNPNLFETSLWAGSGAYWDEKVSYFVETKNRIRFFRSLVRPLHPIFDVFALFFIWKALREVKPTILHTHSSKAGIIGRVAGWLAGVPILIHTFHGFGFNKEQKPWTRWHFIFLEKIIAVLSYCWCGWWRHWGYIILRL